MNGELEKVASDVEAHIVVIVYGIKKVYARRGDTKYISKAAPSKGPFAVQRPPPPSPPQAKALRRRRSCFSN